MPVPGGEAHEICASDLAAVCYRSGLALPVPIFALGRGSATLLGLFLHSNGMDVVLCAVSSSHAAGQGLLTWLLCCVCIGYGWRVHDV